MCIHLNCWAYKTIYMYIGKSKERLSEEKLMYVYFVKFLHPFVKVIST